jgi:F-type H+-transporting ATPase subunit gamma
MASLKDIKRHIKAVRQTQKLTKAMNMVAAARLRATQNRTERFRWYAEEHARLSEEIARRTSSALPPALLSPPHRAGKALLVVFSSERGLCGSFNSNIFQKTDRKILDLRAQGLEPVLYLLGRKARDYYQRRKVGVKSAMVGVMGGFDYILAQKISEELTALFESGEYREIALVYTRFESLTRHLTSVSPYLPLGLEEGGSQDSKDSKASKAPKASKEAKGAELSSLEQAEYLIEPQAGLLLKRLIPRSLAIKVFRALLETVTSENAARMQAMDNASRSCKDIIESLTMSYNKARQASVTSELLDIVNGAEALKD